MTSMGTDIAILILSTAFLLSLTIGFKVVAKVRETAKEKPKIVNLKERISKTLQKTKCDLNQETKLQKVANNVSQKIQLKIRNCV